ncbi:UDP-N-acetylglucosamine--N-acetylmuramyl-(pentapeptide) pyrophosphoryl-undecaprenol N-acetylglucosamine transferase, partial [Candidatus Gottesmanbacteria bacterium]|nr:UDP-N-acetylglucosamine--N-acetylmuramyl-(pentapeptide) pyrophosphoryl-undecaprenol N-acetylglucosamine transferase [Candidatus Gottesmanbacteria bacterium]
KNTFGDDHSLSLEYKSLAAKKNIIFVNIISGRIQRFLTLQNLLAPFALVVGFLQAVYYLVKYQPDLILSFGGYLSVPMVLAGWFLRIPVISHEQGFAPGMATKINAIFSTRICVSWEESLKNFPSGKTVLTGNPLGEGIRKTYQEKSPFPFPNFKLPVIFITGGNQGSHDINMIIKELLPSLLPWFIVIHQCGGHLGYHDENDLKNYVKTMPESLQKNYFVISHIANEDMGIIYNRSALVIGRSGINTISELIYWQKKAILIPLPFSQGKEQEKNARYLENLGLGVVINQNELTPDKLKTTIRLMLTRENKTDQAKITAVSSLFKNAAEKIAAEAFQIYDQKGSH